MNEDKEITRLCKLIQARLKELGSDNYLDISFQRSDVGFGLKDYMSYNNEYWDDNKGNPLNYREITEVTDEV